MALPPISERGFRIVEGAIKHTLAAGLTAATIGSSLDTSAQTIASSNSDSPRIELANNNPSLFEQAQQLETCLEDRWYNVIRTFTDSLGNSRKWGVFGLSSGISPNNPDSVVATIHDCDPRTNLIRRYIQPNQSLYFRRYDDGRPVDIYIRSVLPDPTTSKGYMFTEEVAALRYPQVEVITNINTAGVDAATMTVNQTDWATRRLANEGLPQTGLWRSAQKGRDAQGDYLDGILEDLASGQRSTFRRRLDSQGDFIGQWNQIADVTPTATSTTVPPSFTPTRVAPTVTETRRPTLSPTPTPTREPALIGGKRLEIGKSEASNNAELRWQQGNVQTGYAVAKLSLVDGRWDIAPSGLLDRLATVYEDLSGQAGCYVLLPIGASGVLGVSDFLCMLPNTHSGIPSQGFRMTLDAQSMAQFRWSPQTQENGYVLVALETPQRVDVLPRAASVAAAQTNGRFSCFALVSLNDTQIPRGVSDVLCGLPGISTLGISQRPVFEARPARIISFPNLVTGKTEYIVENIYLQSVLTSDNLS